MGSYMVAIKKTFLVAFIVLLAISGSASATTSKMRIGDWNVVKTDDGIEKHCIAYSKAFRSKGSSVIRNEPFAIIEYKGHKQYSFGVNPGYAIDVQKGVVVKVDDRARLIDVKLAYNAWTYSEVQDVHLINEMLKNQRFIKVRSYNINGESAVDYYSLRGLTNLVNYFETRCN